MDKSKAKRIICTVTNDLSQDQRMQRICTTLAKNGHDVTLVGRLLQDSLPLSESHFRAKRLSCFFTNGFLFYLEYNLRLFYFLMTQEVDVINSVDLDTIAAGRVVSWIRRKDFTFDAHELFTELPELQGRYFTRLMWKGIERFFVTTSTSCYTINKSVAKELKQRTGKEFKVVQNYPTTKEHRSTRPPSQVIDLVYQGVLNIGRGLEELILAVGPLTDVTLQIIGRGDIEKSLHDLAKPYDNIIFHGFIQPEELHAFTSQFHIGLNLLSERSGNYYYSSANKFFDYIMAGLPIISMNFPEYLQVNENFEVAVLINDLETTTILNAVDTISADYDTYSAYCQQASSVYNWKSQELVLKSIYDGL